MSEYEPLVIIVPDTEEWQEVAEYVRYIFDE
jgi:hypothetical protein